MRIVFSASGASASLLADNPEVTTTDPGRFAFHCERGTSLAEFLDLLGLSEQALLCIVDDQSIPVSQRADIDITGARKIALVPPIRAG